MLAFSQYKRSDQHLVSSKQALYEAGATLDTEGCVDAVLEWFGDCQALEAVCDKAVDTMMLSCLAAQDRKAECDALEGQLDSTHLDFERCASRGLNAHEDHSKRRPSNACASTYRAFADWCKNNGHMTP